MKIKTHYDNLGVMRTAQPEVIKAAYKALAQKYHPDRNPNNPDAERIMKIINTAYQVLIDPISRAEHDRWIKEQEAKIHANQSNQHQNSGYQNSDRATRQNTFHEQRRYDDTSSQNYQFNQGNPYRTNTGYHYDANAQDKNVINKPSFWSFGRMRRTTYIMLSVPAIFILIIVRMAVYGGLGSSPSFASLLIAIMIELVPWSFLVFIGAKRLHDCNYKAWWIVIPFVVIAMWFWKPTQGANRFGADPRDDYFDDEIEIEKDNSIWIGVAILLFYNLVLSPKMIDEQQKYENRQNNTPTYQGNQPSNTQTPNISSDDIVTPNINSEPSLNPQLVLAEAKKRYDNAVANINAVWSSLPPSTQELLRAEQRAINENREADCTAYGNAQSADRDLAKAYRYLCEVPQLNERAEHLKTQINTMVAPPAPKNVGSAYQQNYQYKDDVVLSQMMNIYNNPQLAPPVPICQDNIYCNAFSALSQYWVDIPDDYRYQGEFNIKYQAQIGDGYGLNKGFTLNQEKSVLLAEAGNLAYYNSGGNNTTQEKIFAEGLVVLLYIEDMNGWL